MRSRQVEIGYIYTKTRGGIFVWGWNQGILVRLGRVLQNSFITIAGVVGYSVGGDFLCCVRFMHCNVGG